MTVFGVWYTYLKKDVCGNSSGNGKRKAHKYQMFFLEYRAQDILGRHPDSLAYTRQGLCGHGAIEEDAG